MTESVNAWRTYDCVNRIQEAEGVDSFYFVPSDFGALPEYRPGQYVSLKADFPETGPVEGDFTLSQAPGSGLLRITVKHSAESRGKRYESRCGAALHRWLKVGGQAALSEPRGEFCMTLGENHPAVFVAGGIGITAILPMVQALATENPLREVHLLYSTQSSRTMILREEINAAMKGLPNGAKAYFFTQPDDADRIGRDYDAQGRIDAERIRSFCQDPDADFWLCGSKSFTDDIRSGLLEIGVIAPRIHVECFGDMEEIR